MYGMIHRALHEMLADSLNQDYSTEILKKLGIGPDAMLSTALYPDEKTHEMVAAVAETMGVTIPECLEHFGRYWIVFSERGLHRNILDFTGKDIVTFIKNLDAMHNTIVAVMPQANVPSFKIAEHKTGELLVEYQSSRVGLEPFVTGLLYGLLDKFDHQGSVDYIDGTTDPSQFRIIYK